MTDLGGLSSTRAVLPEYIVLAGKIGKDITALQVTCSQCTVSSSTQNFDTQGPSQSCPQCLNVSCLLPPSTLRPVDVLAIRKFSTHLLSWLQSTFTAAMQRDSGMKVRKPEPAEIEFKNMRFLITYRPTDATMDRFIEELKKHNVKDVVRVCDPTYNTARLHQEGITVMDLPFDDGTPPPEDVVTEWFNLLRLRFTDDSTCCVAVHCIAGLGRAPVLVALALIELGMKYEDAVELIREKRRGAINAKQLAYLEKYRPKSRLKMHSNGHKNCKVM